MKFKIVSIYSGYNEMSIDGVVLVNWSNDNIQTLVDECFIALKHKFIDNDEIDFWDEFSSKGVINERLGHYGCDEEGFNLVIREDDYWYNRLSNVENWTDKEFKEWKEFCNAIA